MQRGASNYCSSQVRRHHSGLLAEDKSEEVEPEFVLLDIIRYSAICTFPLELGNHMERRPIVPARFLQRRTAELLMYQEGCQIHFQTQSCPSATTLHPDAFAGGPEIERRHGAGLSRFCGK